MKAENKPKVGSFGIIAEKFIEKSIKYDPKYHFCSHFKVFMSYKLIFYILNCSELCLLMLTCAWWISWLILAQSEVCLFFVFDIIWHKTYFENTVNYFHQFQLRLNWYLTTSFSHAGLKGKAIRILLYSTIRVAATFISNWGITRINTMNDSTSNSLQKN